MTLRYVTGLAAAQKLAREDLEHLVHIRGDRSIGVDLKSLDAFLNLLQAEKLVFELVHLRVANVAVAGNGRTNPTATLADAYQLARQDLEHLASIEGQSDLLEPFLKLRQAEKLIYELIPLRLANAAVNAPLPL